MMPLDTSVVIGLLSGGSACGWFVAWLQRGKARAAGADLAAMDARFAELGEEHARVKAAAHVREVLHGDLQARVQKAEDTASRLRFLLDHGAAPSVPVLPAPSHVPYERWPICQCGATRHAHVNGTHRTRVAGGYATNGCLKYEQAVAAGVVAASSNSDN